MSMHVIVNGSRHVLPDGSTVSALVQQLGERPQGRGIAVAVGGEVVPRGRWESTVLRDGMAVEVVVAVQGG